MSYGEIIRLPVVISSQIAAGEVVERPASVVKELIENSLDAGARRIVVEIDDFGMKIIRVSDDGIGMSREDAMVAPERFATSKLRNLEDLENISSLGFRGEALPSIASCSRFTLETRRENDSHGTHVYIQGGETDFVKDKGLPSGTTVTVNDLFYNTPARLKFIKSSQAERRAIIDVVERLALARPNVSISLLSKGKTVLHTGGRSLENALGDIFGPQVVADMIEIKTGEKEGLGICGYVGLPKMYRRKRDRQIFSVNNRPVGNKMLGWALDSAFEGLLSPGSYPVAVLNLAVPPGEIDVNVHPTKYEIKFKDERKVRYVISASVSGALAKTGYMTSQDVSTPAPAGMFQSVPKKSGSYKDYITKAIQSERIYPKEEFTVKELTHRDGLGDWFYLGSFLEKYLIVTTPKSLLIVDKHALAESMGYRALCLGSSSSQELLMPEMIRLEPAQSDVFKTCQDYLKEVGFEARMIGEHTVLVSKVPMVLGYVLVPGSIREILGMAVTGQTELRGERALMSIRLATAACHGSVRAGEKLTKEEAEELISKLKEDPSYRTCPHGRPTVKELPIKEVDGFFGRTSPRKQN